MNIGLSFVVIAALFFYLLPSMIASIRNVEHGGASQRVFRLDSARGGLRC
ncbi:MAG TPA: hypothetical protein VK208_23360 [Pyrinomonadaceae bacterium]|nr:hypothetical protein [Pyrinomonadaceae bacterium]